VPPLLELYADLRFGPAAHARELGAFERAVARLTVRRLNPRARASAGK
jgi:hypothetical protein